MVPKQTNLLFFNETNLWLQAGLVTADSIIIDSKSGVSGAGKNNYTFLESWDFYFSGIWLPHLCILFIVHLEELWWRLLPLSGRSAKEANLYTEVSEGIHAYGIAKHRHGKLKHLQHMNDKKRLKFIQGSFEWGWMHSNKMRVYFICSRYD